MAGKIQLKLKPKAPAAAAAPAASAAAAPAAGAAPAFAMSRPGGSGGITIELRGATVHVALVVVVKR